MVLSNNDEMRLQSVQAIAQDFAQKQEGRAAIGCVGTIMQAEVTMTSTGVRYVIEKLFNGLIDAVKNTEQFKALPIWKGQRVADFNNLSMPHEFQDAAKIGAIAISMSTFGHFVTMHIVVQQVTGLFDVFETHLNKA